MVARKGCRQILSRFDQPDPKPDGLPDVYPERELTGLNAVANGPRVQEYHQEFCRRTTESQNVVTIGEMPELSVDKAKQYVGEDDGSMNILLNFEHVELDRGQEHSGLLRIELLSN